MKIYVQQKAKKLLRNHFHTVTFSIQPTTWRHDNLRAEKNRVLLQLNSNKRRCENDGTFYSTEKYSCFKTLNLHKHHIYRASININFDEVRGLFSK